MALASQYQFDDRTGLDHHLIADAHRWCNGHQRADLTDGLHRAGQITAFVFQFVGNAEFLAQPHNALRAAALQMVNGQIQRPRSELRIAADLRAGSADRSHRKHHERGGAVQLLDHVSPDRRHWFSYVNNSSFGAANVMFRDVHSLRMVV